MCVFFFASAAFDSGVKPKHHAETPVEECVPRHCAVSFLCAFRVPCPSPPVFVFYSKQLIFCSVMFKLLNFLLCTSTDTVFVATTGITFNILKLSHVILIYSSLTLVI